MKAVYICRTPSFYFIKIESIMTQPIASITISGESERRYTFKTYPINVKDIGDISVVYIFARRFKKDGKFLQKPLYVGESGQFQTRLNSHNKFEEVRRLGANVVNIYEISGESQRLQVETVLRHSLNCPCNEQ